MLGRDGYCAQEHQAHDSDFHDFLPKLKIAMPRNEDESADGTQL
jgi:hypothetical protein